LLLGGIIIGLGVAYACFRVGFEAGDRSRGRHQSLLARDVSVWLDGEEVSPVGNVWIERVRPNDQSSHSFASRGTRQL
jgi:hypothetical protein